MMRGTRGQVWLVAVLTIGVWFVAAPRSASADCVTFYVSGSSDGAYVEGSATIWLDIEGCWGEEYTGDVDVEVAVDGPRGWNFDLDSGYAYATASTFVAINGQYGTYDVDGDGYAHYVWWYFDHYSDSASVHAPPPPPPPPTIGLSASATTVNYNAEHVTITASVGPPGYGYESMVQWSGGYAVPGTNLQRKVSTAQVGSFQVTAFIPDSAAQDSVAVNVHPYVILTPTTALTYVGFNDEVITAEVGPPEFSGQLQWSTDPVGAGQVHPSEGWKFLVSTQEARVVHVYASLGQGQQPAVATVEIQPAQQAPQLRLFLEVPNDDPAFHFNPADPVGTDATPAFVPGSYRNNPANPMLSVSMPVPSSEGPNFPIQTVRLIAAFVNASGQIVAPPSGVTQASFWLSNTSAWPGYAMNAGSSQDPDFQLVSPSAEFSTSDPRIAQVDLRVYDYGGETNASVQAGGQQDTIRIPIEHTQGQRLPQAGWTAWKIVNGQLVSEWVSGAGNQGDDSDGGPGANQHVGDGLSRHDEYRGYIIQGVHRRLHPDVKDLFVQSNVPEGVGSARDALSALSPSMSVWQVHPNELGDFRVVNPNSVIGVYDQRGLVIVHITADPMFPPNEIKFGGTPMLNPDTNPWRGPRRVAGEIEIYTFYIRLYSPPTPSGTVDDAVDPLQRSKTIAHEIGHGIEMEHAGPCPAPGSIMQEGPPATTDTSHPCWNNIPTSYDSTNVGRIQLRHW